MGVLAGEKSVLLKLKDKRHLIALEGHKAGVRSWTCSERRLARTLKKGSKLQNMTRTKEHVSFEFFFTLQHPVLIASLVRLPT